MAEIGNTPPLPPPLPLARPNPTATELTLKLMQSMNSLMQPGENADAEVVSVRQQAQHFEVMLKLTLASGREALLQANSTRPLEPGNSLALTALSQNRLSALIKANSPQMTTVLRSLDMQQLPPGTQLQGKVIASQPLPAQPGVASYQVVVKLLNSPLAGQQLLLDTDLQLAPGSLLTAQVQGNQSLSLLPLSTRLDHLALTQQLSEQQSRQAPLDGLFKALAGLKGADMPDGLRGALDKLLAGLPDASQLSSGKGVAQALAGSGPFLEANLLGGQTAALNQDLKANLLRLIGQLQLTLPGINPLSAATNSAMAQALPAFLRNALSPFEGQGARPHALTFPLPSRLLQDMDEEPDLAMLLKLAASAIARLQTHQLSSLAQSQIGPDGSLLTTWQTEIPMRNQQELVPLQVKIQSQEPPQQERPNPQETLWRVELAFDLAPLGPLQVQAQLLRGSLSSQLWAERPATAQLIGAELGFLRQRLNACGITVGELDCRQGVPPQGPRTQLEQRWVDETA